MVIEFGFEGSQTESYVWLAGVIVMSCHSCLVYYVFV